MKFFDYIAKSIAAKVAIVVIVMLVLAGGFYATKNNMFGLNFKLFGSSTMQIEETANVIEQIKKISEFTTACYYEEYVIKNRREKTVRVKGKTVNLLNGEVAIITKATVRAGYDLGKLSQDDLRLSDDTLYVNLPAPEVFDIIMNPSDYEIFVEEGKWTHDEITAMQVGARDSILSNALASGLLEKANTVGEKRIENMFKTFGFETVKVAPTALPDSLRTLK